MTRCLQHLGMARAQLGQLEHGQTLLKEAASRARRLPCYGCSATSLFHLALLHIPLGAYDQALTLFDQADTMGREGGLGMIHSMQRSYRGLIHLERGQPELAAAHFQAVLADAAVATVTRLHATIFQAELDLRAGHPEAARASLEPLLAAGQPLGAAALRLGLPVLARARHATGDLAGALDQVNRLMAFEQARVPSLDGAAAVYETVETLLASGHSDHVGFVVQVLSQVAGATGGAIPGAWLHEARGLEAQHAGQTAQAAAHYRACIAVWQGAGLPFREGRARLRLAGALLPGTRRDREEARRELALARALLEQVGARAELDVIARLEGEYGLSAPGPERELLTRREREVLGLLSQGLPNRRIGTALGISERTVEVHVTNILAKLEVTSRVQAATYALEHQLSTGPKG
ncbi:LuxR C-terminal-related transcriptional regulator [Deinococcus malanensis]|uniref:LuxR C-terminal-related transcriptional regulator n=1 Tax=Deinococcus malanensis TaxID=1706855 RepID=UPI003627474B